MTWLISQISTGHTHLLGVRGVKGQQSRDVEHDLLALELRVHRILPGLVVFAIQPATIAVPGNHHLMTQLIGQQKSGWGLPCESIEYNFIPQQLQELCQ